MCLRIKLTDRAIASNNLGTWVFIKLAFVELTSVLYEFEREMLLKAKR